MEPKTERILRWFSYSHLPEQLQASSKIFSDLAAQMLVFCPTPSAERTTALRKLLESKDCFVRALIEHMETELAAREAE
jgi:hypothetical protein